MSEYLHIMLMCGTIIFHTQKYPLKNKNFGAYFKNIFSSTIFAFLRNGNSIEIQRHFLIIYIFLHLMNNGMQHNDCCRCGICDVFKTFNCLN